MIRSCIRCSVMTILLLASGCGFFGDAARDRTLDLHQIQRVGDPSDAFTVDVSHLPADAIERRTEDMSGRTGPVTKIELREGYPVRVVLFPATQP